ncbi:MAG TPA: DUF1906 domain-containing protein [Gemmatimonadales bacterium]|nr:DUF1906 domain-containing protein [Gemmatimonadales bacterium]
MIEGVDYSFDHPDAGGLYAVGKRFAGRYIGPGSGLKMLTRAEADDLAAHGLAIVALVEGAAQDALSGFATGKLHAELALEYGRGVGMPEGHPYYAAVDFDVNAEQWPRVQAYFQGFASVVGFNRTGMYGGYQAMVWAARDATARWLFQTYAWSAGRWFPDNNMEQYRNDVSLVGGTVDLCRGITPYFGQWMTGGDPVTTPVPTPAETAKAVWAQKIASAGLGMGPTPAADWLKVAKGVENYVKDPQTGLPAILAAVTADTDTPDLAGLLAKLDALTQAVQALTDKPLIDAVAVGKAIASDPTIVLELGQAVAAHLGKFQGEITLGGKVEGGIVATPA